MVISYSIVSGLRLWECGVMSHSVQLQQRLKEQSLKLSRSKSYRRPMKFGVGYRWAVRCKLCTYTKVLYIYCTYIHTHTNLYGEPRPFCRSSYLDSSSYLLPFGGFYPYTPSPLRHLNHDLKRRFHRNRLLIITSKMLDEIGGIDFDRVYS